jgi:hypothetical protein
VLLTSSACVNAGAGAFDPSGLWFEPARSGYGINLFARPDVDFAVMYVYDAAGQARWLLGQNPAFGSAPLTLYQYRGYCPACTVGAVTRQAVGSFTRSFDAGAEPTGRWTIAASFAAPLTGSWSAADVASRQLTDRKACAP